MLPAPARIAPPPSPKSKTSWTPAVPPPPVEGGVVGNALADRRGVGDAAAVGDVLAVAVADAAGDVVPVAVADAVEPSEGLAVVVGGTLYVNSGYGMFGEMPGNVLLAFTVDGK